MTEAKARVGRTRKTRADLERQLKACKREIANARERLIEATKQQTATSEMLRIISDLPLQSVLDAVAEHAARLCDNTAEIYRLENNLIRLVASYGELPVHIQAREGFPVNRDRVIGRTICDQRSVHVHDLAAEDSEYPLGSSDAKRLGHRTTLGIPLLRERTLIGGILFRRWEVRPFSDNQITLLESFADQAAIAIENVRLFEAEKQRTLALAQANRDLAEREAKIRRLVDANIIGIFIWDFDGHIVEANDAFLRIVAYDREDLVAGLSWTDLTPPEWCDDTERAIQEVRTTGITQPREKEFFRKDGSRVPIFHGNAMLEESETQGVAFVLDLTERKKAEEALRASEERLRTLMQFSFEVYWETDAQHRFVQQEFSERLGDAILPGAGIGKTRWEAPYSEPDEEAWRNHRKALDTHLPFRDFELARPTLDGGKRFFSVSGLPVSDKMGRFIGYRGVARDITERKHIEEALRQREKELRDIVETIPAIAGMSRPDGSIAFTSRRWIEYTGLSAEETEGSRWQAAVHPDDLDTHLSKWRDSLATGERFESEVRLRAAHGEYRWFLVRALPLRDEMGNILRWYSISADVEDRKRAEAALRDSEEQWKAVFENNPTMYFMVDPTGAILSVNPFGAEKLGYSSDELIGRPLEILFHPADREHGRRNAAACLEFLGQTSSWELRKIRKDGKMLWVRETAKAMLIKNRPVVLIACEDITENKRAAEALRDTQTQLAHANRVATMGQLTASIAHEVNQPIFATISNAQAALHWLDAEPPNIEEVREALGCIVRDGHRAGAVVGRVRNLSKKRRLAASAWRSMPRSARSSRSPVAKL